MKLYSFRVQNYKSIKDSGICYIEDKITIFAGKNGSGKSNILEALNKFTNQGFDFDEDNYNYGPDKPIISVTYKLDLNDIEYIKKQFMTNIGENVTVKLEAYEKDDNAYIVDFSADFNKLHETNEDIVKNLIDEIGNEDLSYGDTFSEVTQNFEEEEAQSIIQKLKENGFVEIENLKELIKDYILDSIPEFVYQKTIENELKSVISAESIKKNDFHKDIAKLMSFSADDFNSEKDKSWRSRRGNILSQELTGNFGDFYSQDKIELKFTLDGDEVVMDVIEPEKASHFENKIENKSDGLKWFIAFYVKLNVTKNKNVIILLDEPGMYLHARACKEMLKIFDEISKESQIILATHNPYLIDAQKIGCIRLVLNESDSSTIIENKPHRYRQDTNMDALTPILTSIGYELTMSIHVGDQKNNLIVEGISDYYFLQGMAKILNIDLDYLIIPSIGAEKINYIASILVGWGLNTIVLLDSDKKGKDKAIELVPLVNKCIFVSDKDNQSIEDLFTKEDYCLKILELDSTSNNANSKIKKDLKIDEILKSKQFLQKIENNEIVLSDESKENFKKVFEIVKNEFNELK